MATAVNNGDGDSVLNCPICLEKLKLPKRLPCLHTFCEQCIQSYICASTAGEEKTDMIFRCPTCRMEVTLPNKLAATDWTEKLSTNHLIKCLIDSKSNELVGNEIFCDPCKYANERMKAKFYCSKCKEYFCEQCLTYLHKRKRDNNTHTVTPISGDMPLKPLEVDEICPVHEDKLLKTFCCDHEKLCCSLCFMKNHRKCDVVKSLDEIANDKEETCDMDDFISKLMEVEQCTESIIKDKKDNITQLSKNKEEILQSVENILSDTKSQLDILHKEFKISTEKVFSNSSQNQEFDVDWLIGFQNTLRSCRALAKAIKEQGSKRQLFVTKEKSRMSIEKHFERLIVALNCSETDEQYELEIEEKLNEVQQWSKLATLKVKETCKYALRNIKTNINCLSKHNIFLRTFPVKDASFPQASVPFKFQGTMWRIRCSKKNDDVGIFLECLPGDESDWPNEITAELRILHTSDSMSDKVEHITHKFCKEASNWGYRSFIDWTFLVSEKNGLISNGSMRIKVTITQL